MDPARPCAVATPAPPKARFWPDQRAASRASLGRIWYGLAFRPASPVRCQRRHGRILASDRRCCDPNGGSIFDHLREFGRAFADIEPAKRVEKPSRTKSYPATPGKQRVDQARIAPSVAPASRRGTAAQDLSRDEGVATARLP